MAVSLIPRQTTPKKTPLYYKPTAVQPAPSQGSVTSTLGPRPGMPVGGSHTAIGPSLGQGWGAPGGVINPGRGNIGGTGYNPWASLIGGDWGVQEMESRMNAQMGRAR